MKKPDHTLKVDRRKLTKTGAVVTAGAALGVPAVRAVFSQEATPVQNTDLSTPDVPAVEESTPEVVEETGPAIPEGTTLVAQGFSNPRFIARGSDGTLYVTEAGVGGDEVYGDAATGTGEIEGDATPGATPVIPSPAPIDFTQTRGYTGAVSSIGIDGTRTVLVDGLVSYGSGVGPHGIALGAGEIYFAIGGVAIGLGIEPLPQENTVNRFVLETGELSTIASTGSFEVENNPDGTDVNPNLYDMIHHPEGNLMVNDAGGNTLYNVDIDTGQFTLAGVVPGIMELAGIELDPDLGSGQPVPTGIAVSPANAVYIALLREFWPPEAPSILTWSNDGEFTPLDQSEPFQWTVALTVGPDSNLYASELFGPMTDQGPGPGRIVRLTVDGVVEPVLENVPTPHGLTFDTEGNLYAVINSLGSAPDMPIGMVVRMDGVATLT